MSVCLGNMFYVVCSEFKLRVQNITFVKSIFFVSRYITLEEPARKSQKNSEQAHFVSITKTGYLDFTK